jgi:hypothetical protein
MEGRPPLQLVWSKPDEQPVRPSDSPDESESESEGVLRRRYTVTVQPDGSELIDEVEEWRDA